MKCREKQPGCAGTYERWTSHIQRQAVCQNPSCLLSKAEKNRQKAEAKKAKRDRATTRKQKQAAKTIKELLKEAQTWCNRAILLRDKGKPCISCGKPPTGKVDAGHYVAVGTGAHWPIRFHWANINGQCSQYCNCGLSGNIIEYRKALVDMVGIEMVEYLENHPAYSYSKEEAIELKAHFMEECRRLEREAE